MSDIITTSSGVTVTPILIDGYKAAREPRSVVHAILGRPDPDVTLREAALRTGMLRLLFASEAESAAAEDLHAEPGVMTLSSADRTSIEMSYVVAGRGLERELDDETRELWLLIVPFQEVRP